MEKGRKGNTGLDIKLSIARVIPFLLFFVILSADIQAELLIGEIDFAGNYFVSDEELSKTVYSANGNIFDQKVLNDDVNRIVKLYSDKGFFNVKVFLPEIQTNDPKKIDITFRILENPKIILENIYLQGNKYISEIKFKENIKTENIDLIQLKQTIREIVEYYSDNTFLFADVKIDSLVSSGDQYSAYLSISEGKPCEINTFKFRGNKTTGNQTLLKISQVEKIKKINPRILAQAEENIRKKLYIKDCHILPLDHRQLLFDIEEDRMTYFSGILGYDNSQEKSNRLSGYLNLDFLNLFGTDRSISLFWQRFSSDRNQIEMMYHESGPFSFPLSADITFFREKVDSTYIKTNVETDIYLYDLINKYGIYFGIDDIFPGSRRPKIVEKNSYRKIGAFWRFNSLDYNLNPKTGTEFYIKYYYIFNQFQNENVRKQAFEFSWIRYKNLLNRLVLSVGLNADVIENKKISDFEFFYLGGNSNLRGFNEDQFYGYRIGWSNLELRYLLSRNSRTFIFLDYGYTENQEYKFGLLLGTGFGLRIETKIGMLRIDYGLGYQNGIMRNPLDGIIHFGIETKL